MKIKIIDLLNLVYEKKAPKKIIYNNVLFDFDEENNDYQSKAELYLFSWLFESQEEGLWLEVEIIEEKPKKIEEITINENGTLGFSNGNWTARNMDKEFASKINEIVKTVNYLLEKSDKE